MEQATQAKEDFTLEMLKNSPTKCQGSALKLWAPEDADVFTNDVPREHSEVSHHLTQEMVLGRASTGLFLCLWTPHSSLPTSAMWLMEHFSLVTSCTKFSLGNRADLGNSQVGTWHCCWQAETEEQPGSYKPNEKRFCTPLSNSSCLQELIIAALTVALFTLLSLGSLKQYHQNMCLVLFCELGLNMQTFTNLKLTDLIHVIFT